MILAIMSSFVASLVNVPWPCPRMCQRVACGQSSSVKPYRPSMRQSIAADSSGSLTGGNRKAQPATDLSILMQAVQADVTAGQTQADWFACARQLTALAIANDYVAESGDKPDGAPHAKLLTFIGGQTGATGRA